MPTEINHVIKGSLSAITIILAVALVRFVFTLKIEEPESALPAEFKSSTINVSGKSGDYLRGAQLFKDNCATCHHPVKDMTGPRLMGVDKRVDKQLLYAWIKNNATVLKSGNKYFNDLYLKWNKTQMNIFPFLENEDIDAIMAYVNNVVVSKPATP